MEVKCINVEDHVYEVIGSKGMYLIRRENGDWVTLFGEILSVKFTIR